MGSTNGADVTIGARRGWRLALLGCAALAGAALVVSSAAATASPELRTLVSRCERDARATSTEAHQQVTSLDSSLEFTGRRLARRAAECAATLGRAPLAGTVDCARDVALRGFRSYRLGGQAFANAHLVRIRRRSDAPPVPPEVLRGEALVVAGAQQLAGAREVLDGRRRCVNGIASRRPLRRATQRLLPDLARRGAAILQKEQRTVDNEDAIVFGLLLVQLDLGKPPPVAAVEAQLASFERRNPPLAEWRVLGVRTFWVRQRSHAGWSRPFTRERFLRAFDDYVTWKATARGEAINSTYGVVVESDQKWRKVLQAWRLEERRWYTPGQAAIAAYDAAGRTPTAGHALRTAGG